MAIAWLSGACSPAPPTRTPPNSTTVVPTATATARRDAGTFHSDAVGAEVRYVAARPAGIAPDQVLPVVFCLPGRGGTAQSQSASGLIEALDEAVAAGVVSPFALVFLDGGDSYWHRRASGEDRQAMLVDELIPLVASRYGMGTDGRRGLLGWSMGAYGALLTAEKHPDLFVAVVAASPAIWPSYEAMLAGPGDAFDSAEDFAANDVVAGIGHLAPLAVRIDCGEEDPFYWPTRSLVTAFSADRPPEGGFRAGGHDAAFWHSLYSEQIAFFDRVFETARRTH